MKPPYAIGSVPSLSGHAVAYRWRSLPRVRRHRASKPQGSSERVLPWQITMDQLIFASLSHTHYWYEVGMLKVPAVVDRLGLSLLWGPNMRATRIVGHPSLTLPSASSHPTPSPPHTLRNTLFVVVVSTLKAVPISIQYLFNVPSGPTDANAFRDHRLTTQKGYTYAAYETRNIFLKKTLGS